jgi:cytochrome c
MIRTTVLIATLAGFGIGLFAPAWAADAGEGAKLFAAKCRNCHGPTGDGNPAIAKAMKVDLKPLGSAEVQKKSDADLKMIISKGTGKMKAMADISAGDLDNLVAHLRTLKK